jgi:hypothetical protein
MFVLYPKFGNFANPQWTDEVRGIIGFDFPTLFWYGNERPSSL